MGLIDKEEIPLARWEVADLKLCGPIPPHTPFGLSFHFHNWDQMMKFMEEEPEIKSKLIYGYPRIFVHDFIKKLNQIILKSLGVLDKSSLCFPSQRITQDLMEFLIRHARAEKQIGDLNSVHIKVIRIPCNDELVPSTILYSVLYPVSLKSLVLKFWQISGETISARFAAHCLRLMGREDLVTASFTDPKYLKGLTTGINDLAYSGNFELGGTNTKRVIQNEREIKLEIRKRIAKELSYGRLIVSFPSCDDVYLFPTGMSAIYNSLRLSLAVSGLNKSVCFGFSYKHTPKVFEYFGPGSYFLGNGDEDDLAKLEVILERERITMLLCEFPTNPLLKSPDLNKLRQLADRYKFILVLDNTIGNMINMQDQGIADIIVISLSKVFSGYSDVMGGSLVISPSSIHYNKLKNAMNSIHEDNLWCEEAAVLELNFRDYVSRARIANLNGETLADLLNSHPSVKHVNYPKFTNPELYNQFRRPDGGYGRLLSFELHSSDAARHLFDSLPLPKGFSIGTNFTLLCPYTLTAHHGHLSTVLPYGIRKNLIRISVGLEDTRWLYRVLKKVLDEL